MARVKRFEASEESFSQPKFTPLGAGLLVLGAASGSAVMLIGALHRDLQIASLGAALVAATIAAVLGRRWIWPGSP
jgi:hypothetical protein